MEISSGTSSSSEEDERGMFYFIRLASNDASAITLLINMANQNTNSYTPKEDFSALSPEVRRTWSKTPPDMKSIMLLSRTGSPNDG